MTALRFGLIPRGEEGGETERELLAATAEALGREVGLHRAADYRGLLAGLEHGVVDVTWLPPFVAARALRAKLVEPVAMVVRDGDASYRSALVARAGSSIRGLSDLRDLRVAWVDRESASGYGILRAALVAAGVQLTHAFATETFLRSHAAVARAVLQGQVDVGATCAHLTPDGVRYARSPLTGDTGISSAELQAVFDGGPVPADLFAVRAGLPAAIAQTLERALLQGQPARLHAAARALACADGFALPTPEHRRKLDSLFDA